MGSLLADFRRFARKRGMNGSSFLVGGSVRAILAGTKNPKDIDIALRGNALKAARGFAAEAGATFVLLDERFGMARVVRGNEHLDIARLRGRNIEEDLLQRDITINAMALPLFSRRLIDPLGGARDLMKGTVRIISEENLVRDPLRILRCYRFSAAGGFRIEKETALVLKRLAPLLKKPAPERITEELKKILACQGAARALERMLRDGILKVIMPGFRSENLRALRAMRRAGLRPATILPAGRAPGWAKGLKGPGPEVRFPLELAVLSAGAAGRATAGLVLSKKERELVGRLHAFRRRLGRLFKREAASLKKGALKKGAAVTGLLRDAQDEIYIHLLFTYAFFTAESEEAGGRFAEFSRALLTMYLNVVRPRQPR
ncbi:MAG: hypothetical protein M0Z58_01125, partial [Nitrospiraceae bacterium]|nr:hypothetical protein [Nitrospiraceae bacterium]